VEWQRKRHESCLDPEGWLSLAGLHWLSDGENTFGLDSRNRVVLETPNAATFIGVIKVRGEGSVFYTPVEGTKVLCDGNEAKETIRVVTDAENENSPSLFRFSSLVWFIIKRGGVFAIRVKDRESPVLKSFKGHENFPIDLKYRVKAHYESIPNPIRKQNATATGTEEITIIGRFTFQIDGQDLSLVTTEDPTKRSMLMLADQTTRKDTYGGGRYLWIDPIDTNGDAIIDFNKAYSPPCIFTPYATCSRPPPENKLPIAIEAGEKAWGGHH